MLTITHFKNLRKEEFVEFLRNVAITCGNNDPDTLSLSDQVNAVTTMVSQLDNALLYEQGNALTAELESLDNNRDRAITGFRYLFLAHTYEDDLAKREAATSLLARLDEYGPSIAKMNYESQSTVLTNFVDDCEQDGSYKDAISLLNLGDWLARVKQHNEAFRSKYQERIAEDTALDRTSVTALRPGAMEVYDKLIRRIGAFNELDDNGTYATLVGQLTTLCDRYLQIINGRSGNGGAQSEE